MNSSSFLVLETPPKPDRDEPHLHGHFFLAICEVYARKMSEKCNK